MDLTIEQATVLKPLLQEAEAARAEHIAAKTRLHESHRAVQEALARFFLDSNGVAIGDKITVEQNGKTFGPFFLRALSVNEDHKGKWSVHPSYRAVKKDGAISEREPSHHEKPDFWNPVKLRKVEP